MHPGAKIPDPLDQANAILGFRCEACCASPGEECVNLRNRGGLPKKQPHAVRLESLWAARKNAHEALIVAALKVTCPRCAAPPKRPCHHRMTFAEIQPHLVRRAFAAEELGLPSVSEDERIYLLTEGPRTRSSVAREARRKAE